MNELLNVNYDNDRITVSARELHDFLEVGADFRHWFPRMCEYGFEAGHDFNPVKIDRVQYEGGREVKRTVDDAQLTIECAKEICMLQRNEKGKQARQYFIQLEKDWNSPDKIMARALLLANRKIEEKDREIEVMKPKALFADAVSASKSSILIGDLAKLLKQNGYDIGQNRLFEKLRNEGFLVKGKHRSDRNMPTQRSMDMGLFEIKETTITHSDGRISVSKTVKVSGKGQVYFVNRFLRQQMN